MSYLGNMDIHLGISKMGTYFNIYLEGSVFLSDLYNRLVRQSNGFVVSMYT